MSTSLESPLPSHYRSKQEFLASLPPWRRLLAKLNWHPTIEKKVASYASEQRAKQLRLETEKIKRDTEKIKLDTEQIKIKIVQIRNETEQLRSENERLKKEDEQFAELDAKIAALWPSSNANATPVPPIETSSIP
jgi:chromosome segregation ATPase